MIKRLSCVVLSFVGLAWFAPGCEWPPGEEEPVACGGWNPEPCPDGQFCNFPIESYCGFADGSGVCEAIPDACIAQSEPVCGCDGNTYDNACLANAAGVSVKEEHACERERVSCDTSELACLLPEPECPEGQVPQIIDHCFGPCVPVEDCL
jgi:hypothetical protein